MSNLKKACEMALNEEMEKMDKAYAVSLIDVHIDRPMTNYERIKKMSVEEMAENLLGGQAFCPYWMYSLIGKCAKTDCQKCIKQWLETEVKE